MGSHHNYFATALNKAGVTRQFLMNEIALVILGWLLGLLSPLVVQGIRNEYRRREIEKGILAELVDVRFRMASVVYITTIRFGNYDRDLVKWLIPLFEEYQGENPKENLLDLLRKQLELDDKKFSEVAMYGKASPGQGLSVKKYRLPYLESKVAELSLFPQLFQRLALEILANLHLHNEEIEEARFYFKLTYESGLSTENYERALQGANESYRKLGERAKIIVERINSLKNI
ncbi:MAG: hypothetical protein HY274_07535 [Gammaproteobacteria bacterium]|nr:hypothetical protein [Gammaproteobacteria bacterium]